MVKEPFNIAGAPKGLILIFKPENATKSSTAGERTGRHAPDRAKVRKSLCNLLDHGWMLKVLADLTMNILFQNVSTDESRIDQCSG